MNSWMIIIILAVLQGVAEFLPVSSSGHLALLSSLCGLPAKEGAAVSIVLHAGSLVAISIFYFNTLLGFFRKNQLHLLLMVILGSIPAGVVGILLKKSGLIDHLFGDMISVGMGFLITASILRLTGKEKLRAKSDTGLQDISLRQAITVGIVQAFAILPGISRAGSTIAFGIISGIKFEAAAAFSFLLALPAIAGATLLELVELSRNNFQLGDFSIPQLFTAFIISAAVSFASLILLVNLIRKRKLEYFAWYMFFIGAAVVVWQIISASKG
ncbi:MAG: undecaprenyl-diphosphate phosphatase [Lentisphaerae bacterium]|nr:undecaprenyl-diphosphate phosphatase [Lentisphaerota bacterium]